MTEFTTSGLSAEKDSKPLAAVADEITFALKDGNCTRFFFPPNISATLY